MGRPSGFTSSARSRYLGLLAAFSFILVESDLGAALLDYPVRPEQERLRNSDTERLGRFQANHELKPGGVAQPADRRFWRL
jgi:hypothetical protein